VEKRRYEVTETPKTMGGSGWEKEFHTYVAAKQSKASYTSLHAVFIILVTCVTSVVDIISFNTTH